MERLRLQNFIPIIITIPAVSIGVTAMYYHKISTFIWAQNLVFWVIAGLLSCWGVLPSFNLRSKLNGIAILISLLLLILTFINPGMDGVHRWIAMGSLKLNVSMIVIPMLIIALWELLQVKELWLIIVIALVISILLVIQPDASQLTGFAVPMMLMLGSKMDKKLLRSFIVGMLAGFIILAWVFLDSLPAVAYVERIISLLADMGLMWLILGIISLIILPIPFILFPPPNLKLPSICLGLYFIIILLSTIFGNFPVPLMGYGVSPIIGYFIAITWYTAAKINS